MIVVQGLRLNEAHIILGCIFSMLFSDFTVWGLRSIHTPPMTALMEFFHADTETNVHPLPVSWHSIFSSLLSYLCSCMYTMSIWCSNTDAVSLGSWPIPFKVLTLNVTTWTVFLHLSNFGLDLSLSLSSVVGSNTGARAFPWAERALCFTAWRATRLEHMVWIRVRVIFRWLFFFYLINRRYPYRWVAIVSGLNYLTLAVDQWNSA